MNFSWSPSLPLWLLVCLAVLVLLFGLWSVLGRVRGQIPRIAALGIIILFLSGPGLQKSSFHTQPQEVLILVDHSPSMLLRHRQEMVDKAADELENKLRPLPGVTAYRVVVSDSNDHDTRLFETLKQETQNHPDLSAVFLLTDGMNHDTPSSLKAAFPSFEHKHVPIHLLLASKGEETDRTLQILSAPPYGMVGSEAHIRLLIKDLGSQTGENAKIYERQNSDQQQLVSEGMSGQTIDVPIKISRNGANLVELSASELPGEVSTRNNHSVISIQGIQNHLKVMLVSGAPTPSARVWRNLLKADPSVDLVHFIILRSPESADDTPSSELALIPFPTHDLFVEKINQFDLIILDGFDASNLIPQSYIDNITQYVLKGGGLLVISGKDLAQLGSLQDTSLGSILPAHVMPNNTRTALITPKLSALGQVHPVTNMLKQEGPWGKTWGPWYRFLKADHIKGSVLLTTDDNDPLLLLNTAGKGRVAQLLSDQIWLWSRGSHGGGPQQELLRRLSHWLMKEPDLEGERLQAHLEDRKIMIDRYSLTERETLTATILSPDGKNYTVSLAPLQGNHHHLHGTLVLTPNDKEDHGIWTIQQNDLTATIAETTPQTPEDKDLRSTALNLSPLVKESGGGIFWLGQNPVPEIRQVSENETTSGREWAGLALHKQKLPGADHFYPLLPPWLALLLALPLLSLGWWREGR